MRSVSNICTLCVSAKLTLKRADSVFIDVITPTFLTQPTTYTEPVLNNKCPIFCFRVDLSPPQTSRATKNLRFLQEIASSAIGVPSGSRMRAELLIFYN